jgi:hypothetical protein
LEMIEGDFIIHVYMYTWHARNCMVARFKSNYVIKAYHN